MQKLHSVLFVAIIVVMVGCAGQSVAGKPAATPTASSYLYPTMTPTQEVANQTPLTLAQAWGNAKIVSYPTTMGNHFFQAGGAYGEDAVTDDDQVCGSIRLNSTDFAQTLNSVQSLALLNLHTGAITTLQTLPARFQIIDCAVTGQWVMWTQLYGQDNGVDQTTWKISAVNRQTHEVRLLDQNKLPNGQPGPSKILPYPTASHGLAAWTTFADNLGTTAGVIYDFATGTRTLLPNYSSDPMLSWPWVSWYDPNQREVVFKNLATQQQNLISLPQTSFAFQGSAFVTQNANGTSIMLYSAATTDHMGIPLVVANAINGDFVEYPTLNDRLVTWISNNSFFAYDRKLLRLVLIVGNLTGSPDPLISSHYMVWGGRDAQGHFFTDVLDTNTLP